MLRVYGRFHFSELISKCLQQQLLKELKKKTDGKDYADEIQNCEQEVRENESELSKLENEFTFWASGGSLGNC